MNPIDYHIISFINSFAGRSWAFDDFVMLVSQNYALKTGVMMIFLLWIWFRQDGDPAARRTKLIFGLGASWAAVLCARILSFALPFRERPLRSPFLHLVLPHGVNPDSIFGWSSMPSDNAALFFGVAACIFVVSRRAGILAFAQTILTVGFARVYLGYHHPTDILAGAIIGIGMVSLIELLPLSTTVFRMPMQWVNNHPQVFCPVFFYLIFLTGTTFEPLYPLAHFARTTAQTVIGATSHKSGQIPPGRSLSKAQTRTGSISSD